MKSILFWLRWSWRDLRDRWLLVVAIAGTIAVGTGAYAALDSMTTWRTEANDASLALLKAHDVRLTLADGSFIEAGKLQALVTSLPHASSVAASAEHVTVPTRVDASSAGQTIIVPGRLVGVPVGDPGVDLLQVRGGRGFTATDAAQPVAILEDHFATHYKLAIPTSVALSNGASVPVIGRAMSSDYLMVIAPDGGVMAEANYAVVFMPVGAAAEAAGHPGAVNELDLRLTDPSAAAVVRDELQRGVNLQFPDVGATAVIGAEEDARRLIIQDASGDGAFFGMFAMILLGGAAFASFNLTSRIVEAQRRQIGIGLALGVGPRTLAIRPLAVSAEIALMGIALGVLAGVVFGALLRDVLTSMVPMPVFNADFQVDVFVRAAAIGFVLPFAASFYPVWRAVRARPIDAIRTGYLSARRPGLARVGSLVRLPGGSQFQLPIRNVLRTPRRTLLTSLGIAAGITVTVGTLGMLDTLGSGVDALDRELSRGASSGLELTLEAPLPREAVQLAVAAVPGAGRIDGGIRLPATAESSAAKFDLALNIQSLTDNAWTPIVDKGRLPTAADEILLSSKAAADLGLEPGDAFTVRHPQRVSATAVATVTTTMTVAGTQSSPNRPYAYLDPSAATAFGFDGLVNRATVVAASGISPDDLRRSLFELPGVVSVQPIESLVTLMRELVTEFQGILGIAALITLLLALLVAYNSASIAQDERSREIATMLAFGLRIRRVMAMAMFESAIIGTVGTILGIVGGLATLQWLVYGLLPQSMPDFALTPSLGAGTASVAVLLGVVLVALAPVLTIRRLLRMNLPATLRVVE